MMPSRMEATVYVTQQVKIRSTLDWLERVNANRENKLTLFHVILASGVRMMALCPDLNRFVAGRRIYQRRTIDISFVIRREMTEQSTETIVKMTFDPYSTIETIAEQVNQHVQASKKSKISHDEKLSNFLTAMPRFMIRGLMSAGRILDYFGSLPAWYIKGDSMFTSLFIANLGSINLDSILHPMFEWGNASCFTVIGKIKKTPIVSENGEIQIEDVMDVTFTIDHRIAGGFNFSKSLALSKDLVQNPDALLTRPENLPDPFTLA
ncbi:MAG: 2-oxo acid dehydrogenase subunit E2 [Deltaproteobacteria bacterium]